MRYLSNKMTAALAENSTLVPVGHLIATVAETGEETTVNLYGDDFISVSVEQASSSSGSFDIGAAVVGQLDCVLNNRDDRFSGYDLEGARLDIYVRKQLDSSSAEDVRLGSFIVDRPDSYAGQVSVTALDHMCKLEREFSPSSVKWPATLQELAQTACDKCGLVLATSEIPNGSYTVASQPEMENATYLDLVGYIAQATGTFARANATGEIEFLWYDMDAFEGEHWLDGGEFDSSSPYSSGDSADGGDFTDYSSGDSADGGDFSNLRTLGRLSACASLTVFADDVVVTGVSVTACDEVVTGEDGSEQNGEDGETSLYGSEGYVLSLGSNPLVAYGQAAVVAEQVGKRVVGMRFRPFSCKAVTDPSLEPGDPVLVTDRKDNIYHSYITSTKLTVNGAESIECSAKSASRNSADRASAATKAVVAARNSVKREANARSAALEKLKGALEEEISSNGLFSTAVRQSDGSYIYYMHDRSDLASSKVVYKMTSSAVAISTNGPDGPYATGITADGTAILDRIYAVGIDASYINAGTFSLMDENDFAVTKLVSGGSNPGIYTYNSFEKRYEGLTWSAFRAPSLVRFYRSNGTTGELLDVQYDHIDEKGSVTGNTLELTPIKATGEDGTALAGNLGVLVCTTPSFACSINASPGYPSSTGHNTMFVTVSITLTLYYTQGKVEKTLVKKISTQLSGTGLYYPGPPTFFAEDKIFKALDDASYSSTEAIRTVETLSSNIAVSKLVVTSSLEWYGAGASKSNPSVIVKATFNGCDYTFVPI